MSPTLATAPLLGAVLAEATGVPPAGPMKDYSGQHLPIIAATAGCVLLAVGLVLLGWRRRQRRQAHVPAPAQVPDELYELEPDAACEGMYVGTVFGQERFDRVAVHRLGVRSDARLEVHAGGARPGVAILRPRVENLFVPADALSHVGTGSGMAGKFVEPHGLLLLTWRLGEHEVTTGFRLRDPADRPRVLESLRRLAGTDRAMTTQTTSTQSTAVEGGSGHAPETAGQENAR